VKGLVSKTLLVLAAALYSGGFAWAARPCPKVYRVLRAANAFALELKGTPKFTSPTYWREKTAGFGLPGLDLPAEFGGNGFSAVHTAQVFEAMGRHSLDMRDMVGGGHVRPLTQVNNPAFRPILQSVAEGKGYVAIAITEKSAGSDVRGMRASSEKVDGGYLITGEKQYNARLLDASHVIIFTKAPANEGKQTPLNAFVLPIDYPGLKITELNARGLHGNSFGGVAFDQLFVPDSLRIGEDGEGGKIFRNHFLYWRLMMASAAIGTGKEALEQAAARMRERQAFGGPIGRFTHLQQQLAEHTAKLHMASLLVAQAAKLYDQGKYDEVVPLAAMAKAEGVEFALKAADFAMELHGAEGYTDNLDLGQRVADLQGLRIADGTTHVLRQEVVRQIYGQDFWDMAVGGP
jgi:alkylation response protein AidB-like acyl-CoA dehydrogenase